MVFFFENKIKTKKVIDIENIIKKIDCLFDDKPVLVIVTKDDKEYRCTEKKDIMKLRGYFFKDEIFSVIKKIRHKRKFKKILGYLKKQQEYMLPRTFGK